MQMTLKDLHALALSGVLLVGPMTGALRAEDGKRVAGDPPYGASHVAFEWQYSCANGKGCSFLCPGAGGGNNVTKLAIHLGTISLAGTQNAVGIFYEFSTMEIPRGNGFSMTTGISTLSCQVSGMTLDYSGPPRDHALEAAR
jgi:hypothetical protein